MTPATQQTPPTPLTDEERAITVEEAGRLLSLSRGKIYLMMEDGSLPYLRFGRSRRIRMADLRKLMADSLVTRTPATTS